MRQLILSLTIGFITLAGLAPSWGDEVVLLDGTVQQGDVSQIADEKLTIAGKSHELMGLRKVARKAATSAPESSARRVDFANQSQLMLSDIAIADRKLTGKFYGKSYSFPVEMVRNLVLSDSKDQAAAKLFAIDGKKEKLDADRLYVFKDGKLRSLSVAVKAIDQDKVYVIFGEKERSLDRSKVYGIAFARLPESIERVGSVFVKTNQTSTIYGQVDHLKSGKLALKIGDVQVELPWANVAHMNVFSDRMTYLCDLKPSRVESTPLLSLAPGQRSWFADHAADSVAGQFNPIRLDGKAFEKGLCLLSKTQLDYDIPEGMTSFAAVVGLDDETGIRGDCLVKIYVDGEVKFEKRVTGQDKAVDVKINIKGAKELSILCDWADGFDGGDHLSLGDARFIRK